MRSAGDNDGDCIVLVLGMHRSGTSVLTNCLVTAGLRIVNNLLATDTEVNPDGFFEDAEAVELNERMLVHSGRSWMDYRVPDVGQSGSFMADWHQEALQHIRVHYTSGAPWVLKDPRLCLTWRHWLDVLAEAGIRPHVVHIVRHPAMVAASLRRRDALPPDYSFLLWIAYVLAAATASLEVPRSATLSYDALVSGPGESVRAIFDTLGLEALADIDLDNRVRRLGQMSSDAAANQVSEDLWSFALKVYEVLVDRAKPVAAPGRNDLAGLWQQWEHMLAASAQRWEALRDTAQTLQQLSQQLVEIGELHRHAQEVVVERDRQLGEKNQQLGERDRQLEKLRANWFGRLAIRLTR